LELSPALIAYGSVAVMAAAVTLLGLAITKNAAIVTPIAALLSTCSYLIWARIQEGYWDKFVLIAFMMAFVYALIVSIGVLFLGRSLGARYFQDRNAS
jgi:hypothetical protein